MYLSAESPKRSLRSVTIDQVPHVLIGGEGHKTGQGICTMQHYENLELFAEDHFGVQKIPYRWSAQDLITLDKMPYIGPITSRHPNILVATGYRKWGMTNGTAAALLLKDLIMDKDNPYSEVYTPQRFNADPGIKHLLTDNADVAVHFVVGKYEIVMKKPEELVNEEGSVVSVNGKRAGAYRDAEGKLHVVDTTCTHMGCEVEWNHGDLSWDCPCHGSRFNIDGKVLEGPAKEPLALIELND
ncbi:Cytochrome b6-f complex iron-sulfur subunit 1 [compost metagenome]